MPLLGDLTQLLKCLRTALLPLALAGGHLNQLTLNLLQLACLSGERMAALTALLSLAGHCSEALRADLDAWRLLAVAFSGTIQGPIAFFKVVAKPQRIADMIQHHSALARLRTQAPADHLQVQRH
jgi:hypothetical protein